MQKIPVYKADHHLIQNIEKILLYYSATYPCIEVAATVGLFARRERYTLVEGSGIKTLSERKPQPFYYKPSSRRLFSGIFQNYPMQQLLMFWYPQWGRSRLLRVLSSYHHSWRTLSDS